MRNEHNPSGSEKSKFKPIEKLLAAGGALALAASLSACGPEKAGKAGAESNPETTTSVETETPLTPKDPTPDLATSESTPTSPETEAVEAKYDVPEFRDIRSEWIIPDSLVEDLSNLRMKDQNDYTMKQQATLLDNFVRINNPQWENPYPELIEGANEAMAEGKDPRDAQYSFDGTLQFTDAAPEDGGYDPQGIIDSWLITYDTMQQLGATGTPETDVIVEAWEDITFRGDNAEGTKENMFELSYSYERDLIRSGDPESIEEAYVSFDETIVRPVQVLDMSDVEIKRNNNGERYVAMDLVMVKKAKEEGDGVASDRIFVNHIGVSEWSRSIGFYGSDSIDEALAAGDITVEEYNEYSQFTTE